MKQDANDVLRAKGDHGVRELLEGAKPHKLLMHSSEFVAGYVAPDYAIEGVIQKRRIYGLTGRTGDGKTAIKLCVARFLADGLPMAGRETEQCRVLYLAGENPDDVTARWIAMGEHMGFDTDSIDVHFVPGVFKISDMYDAINKEAKELGASVPSWSIPRQPITKATARTTACRPGTMPACCAG
jgi:hypothetical protein